MYEDDEELEQQPKTIEQYEADRKLFEAIEECMRAYLGDKVSQFQLTDFIALTAIQKISEDGIIVTRYPMWVRDGDIPWYKIQGLMKVHQLRMDKESMSEKDNG